MSVDQALMNQLITDNIDTWTSTVKTKSAAGRGSSNKLELYGVKKLRELILELAVRGKLVPQDPNDVPASVLLERIAKEKAQLVKDKVIPRTKDLPALLDSDIPNDLPSGWSIVRLGNLTSKLGSGSTPRGGKNVYTTEGVPFLRSQNIRNEGIKLDDIAYIPLEVHQKMDKTIVLPNDVLLNITGASLGRCTIFPESLVEANVSQHVTIIRLIESQMSNFVHLGILSPMVQRLVWGRQVGMAIEGLSKKVLEMFEFPVPPLEEQHRIVAKVDELMKLCDQLEQQTESSIEAHQVLMTTLLDTLTNSASAEELMQNWQMLAEHFDTLFTTIDSIDQLKQTILQLAVMGKLVPQDPNDEPAAKLLERIAKEKDQLIKDKKIKKQQALPPIAEDEKPFELPNGWEWCRFNDAIDVRDGTHDSPKDATGPNTYPLITSKNFINGKIDFDSARQISSEDHFEIIKRSQVDKLDILFSMIGGNIGNQVIVEDDRDFSIKNVALFKYYNVRYTYPYFVFLYTQNLAKDLQTKAIGGAQPFISLGALRSLLFALPPREEQEMIVTKAKELMVLCDQLKGRLKDSQVTQQHLTDAIVEQAV